MRTPQSRADKCRTIKPAVSGSSQWFKQKYSEAVALTRGRALMGDADNLSARGYNGVCPLLESSPMGKWPSVEYQGCIYQFKNPGILADKDIHNGKASFKADGINDFLFRAIQPDQIKGEGHTPGIAVGIAKPNGMPRDAGACALANAFHVYGGFIVDSGSSIHLVSKMQVKANGMSKYKRWLRDPIQCETANGTSWIEESIGIQFPALGKDAITAYVVDGTPAVISLGQFWKAYKHLLFLA